MNESEQEKLRTIIVQILTMMKANADLIGSLGLQLEAVTQSVRGLDPTFDDVLACKLEGVDAAISPVIQRTLARFDELLLQMNALNPHSANPRSD